MSVVFYSRAGITRQAAKTISKVLQCDVEEIFDMKNRMGVFGYLGSGMDATFKRPTVKKTGKDPVLYDVVAIGTLAWATKMSTPVGTLSSSEKEPLQESCVLSN